VPYKALTIGSFTLQFVSSIHSNWGDFLIFYILKQGKIVVALLDMQERNVR
jgi:hypothetical protein